MTQTIDNIRLWHEMLRKRTKTIMLRNSIQSNNNIKTNNNFMNDSKALIQRFNVSCRVARKLPHLAASRLLMTLNDYDLPIHYTIRRENQSNKQSTKQSNKQSFKQSNKQLNIIFKGKLFLFIIITGLFTLLPDLLRDTIIESVTNAYINGALLAMITIFKKSIYIPIIIIISLLIIIIFYKLYFRLKLQLKNNKLIPMIVTTNANTQTNTNLEGNTNKTRKIINKQLKMNSIFPQ